MDEISLDRARTKALPTLSGVRPSNRRAFSNRVRWFTGMSFDLSTSTKHASGRFVDYKTLPLLSEHNSILLFRAVSAYVSLKDIFQYGCRRPLVRVTPPSASTGVKVPFRR